MFMTYPDLLIPPGGLFQMGPFRIPVDLHRIFCRGGGAKAKYRPFQLIDNNRTMPGTGRDEDNAVLRENMLFIIKPEFNFSV